jgi:hypothetical protein
MPQEVSQFDILASDDIMDESNNPVAQNLDRLVNASSTAHRQQLIAQLKQQAKPTTLTVNPQLPAAADYWFLNQPLDLPRSAGTAPSKADVIVPGSQEKAATAPSTGPVSDEEALAEKLKANRQNLQTVNYQHMKIIQPISNQTDQVSAQVTQSATPAPVTPLPDPAKMLLATRNDLNIATIGRIVNKQDNQPDEIVISLHDHAS